MSDIKNALAQLRAARSSPEVGEPVPAELPTETPASDGTSPSTSPESVPDIARPDTSRDFAASGRGEQGRGEVKTLAGRVPLALHRELTRALLDASEQLRVSKINVDEALEAAIRLVLRDAEVTERWHAELREVRKERREG